MSRWGISALLGTSGAWLLVIVELLTVLGGVIITTCLVIIVGRECQRRAALIEVLMIGYRAGCRDSQSPSTREGRRARNGG